MQKSDQFPQSKLNLKLKFNNLSWAILSPWFPLMKSCSRWKQMWKLSSRKLKELSLISLIIKHLTSKSRLRPVFRPYLSTSKISSGIPIHSLETISWNYWKSSKLKLPRSIMISDRSSKCFRKPRTISTVLPWRKVIWTWESWVMSWTKILSNQRISFTLIQLQLYAWLSQNRISNSSLHNISKFITALSLALQSNL